MGRRVQKTTLTAVGAGYDAGATTNFVYDGWNLLAELDANNSVVCSYMWGLDMSGSLQGAGGVGGLLTVSPNGNGTHFVSYDGNGNVAALTDSSGNISARYEYDPFGQTLRASGTAAGLNAIRFSSKYADFDSSALYYGNRFYIPSFGRWANRDPLQERGGVNQYAFVVNSPTTSIDILGLIPKAELNEIYNRRSASTRAANLACSCRCPDKQINYMITGGTAGKATVYAMANLKDNPEGCGPYNVKFYWWNCYSGSAEGRGRPRQDYGWSSGDDATFYTVVRPPRNALGIWFADLFFTNVDPYHIDVVSIAMFEQCVNGHVVTRTQTASNGLQFTWSIRYQRWTGPDAVTN